MDGEVSNSRTAAEAPAEEPDGLMRIVRSLRNRNYRLFFGGQGLSLIGTWMQGPALSWMVYALSGGKGKVLGVVNFVGSMLAFLVAPAAGVLADRWDRRGVLVVTQALSMLQAIALTLVALAPESGGPWAMGATAKIAWVIALCGFMGLVNGVDIPVRQAFVVEMVDRKEDLSNAIALNSSIFNSARLVGPAIAGLILMAHWGASLCFLINAVSYGAVIWALKSMRLAPHPRCTHHRRMLHSLREGWRYVSGTGPVRSLLLLLAAVSFFGVPYGTLLPLFAELLDSGSRGFGLLVSSAGAGALLGAVFLAARRNVLGLGWWIAVTPAVFGAALIGLAYSRVLWLSMLLLVVTGLAVMLQMGSTNTILQTIVDPDKRGRVMSFQAMAFMGTSPVGALLAGYLADHFGAARVVEIGGAVCVLSSAVFLSRLGRFRRAIRPIYLRMGILTARPGEEALLDQADGRNA